MGFGGPGTGHSARSAINITPLVDIVLVMLVVFMIAVPAVNRQIPVEVPPVAPADAPPPPERPMSLEIRADQTVVLDDNRGQRKAVRRVDLAPALRAQLARPGMASTVFVAVASPVAWRDAIGVMDTIRGVGGSVALRLERPAP